MNWHARQITNFQQKFDLSNYQVNWIAYGKGLVTGLVIGLATAGTAAKAEQLPTNVYLHEGSSFTGYETQVHYGCVSRRIYNPDQTVHVVVVDCFNTSND